MNDKLDAVMKLVETSFELNKFFPSEPPDIKDHMISVLYDEVKRLQKENEQPSN